MCHKTQQNQTKYTGILRYKHIYHSIPAWRPDQVFVSKKKRTCQIVDVIILVDHGVKINKSEKQ